MDASFFINKKFGQFIGDISVIIEFVSKIFSEPLLMLTVLQNLWK